jgi:hypothetical protein
MGLLSAASVRKRINSAGALSRSGDPAAAIEKLAVVLAELPEDLAANVEMARALTLLDDPAGAEAHYRTALQTSLEYSVVVELAQSIAAQGRIDEAEDHLDAALQMTMVDKKLDAGEVHLARAMLCAADGRIADARSALAQIPDSSGRSVKDLAARVAAGLATRA